MYHKASIKTGSVSATTQPSRHFSVVSKNNNLFVKTFYILFLPTTQLCLSNNNSISSTTALFSSRCECLQVLVYIPTQMLQCVPLFWSHFLYSALPSSHDINCDRMRLLWCVCLSTLAVQTFCSCTAGTDRQTDGSPTDIRTEGH